MKTVKLPLGLLSSLLLSAGLTKAAEIADPLRINRPGVAFNPEESVGTCEFCLPCSFPSE